MTIVNTYNNFHVQIYKAQLIGAANVIEQHLTLSNTPCPAAIDTTLNLDSCIPHKNSNHILVWRDPQHKHQERNTLGIHEIKQQRLYILIPSLHISAAIQEECGSTWYSDMWMSLKNFYKNYSTGTKYAKTVADDVVAPILEANIVQTLFLQKQTMTHEWECWCFLQREITQLQKWMDSVFPSTAVHFIR